MDETAKPQPCPEAEGEASSAEGPIPAKKPYEPPRVVQVQNVRDLVAGGVGSRPDARGRAVFS